MKTSFKKYVFPLVIALSFVGQASAFAQTQKTIRFSEMNSKTWAQFQAPHHEDMIVQFKVGDKIPLNFKAEGNLVETVEVVPTFLLVKQDFWLKYVDKDVKISTDGKVFRSHKKALAAEFEGGTDSSEETGIVNAINLWVRVNLK